MNISLLMLMVSAWLSLLPVPPVCAEKIELTGGTVINAPVSHRDKDSVWLRGKNGVFSLPAGRIAGIRADDGSISPYDYPAYIETIKERINSGDYAGSARLCVKLSEFYPDNDDLRVLSAMLFQKAGDIPSALAHYSHLVSVNAADAAVINNLGVIHAAKDANKALDLLARAVSVDPSLSAARHNLAELLMARQEYARAAEEYSLVLSAEPANEQAGYNLGVAYFKLGKYGKASEQWRRVLDLREDEDSARALEAVKALGEGAD